MTNSEQYPRNTAVLATDLDGTLIPLLDEPQNEVDLIRLTELIRQQSVTLVYVTGRHLALTLDAMKQHRLPLPDWLIADVGTSIFRRNSESEFILMSDYLSHLQEMQPVTALADLREKIELENVSNI